MHSSNNSVNFDWLILRFSWFRPELRTNEKFVTYSRTFSNPTYAILVTYINKWSSRLSLFKYPCRRVVRIVTKHGRTLTIIECNILMNISNVMLIQNATRCLNIGHRITDMMITFWLKFWPVGPFFVNCCHFTWNVHTLKHPLSDSWSSAWNFH